jgi:putative ABC transport system permease protein
MKLYSVRESVAQAFATIAARKFRAFLTVLGVIVGTTSVILVSSLVTGMNARFVEMIERFGTSIAFVSKWQSGPRFGDDSLEEQQRKVVSYEDGMAIRELPSVEDAVPCLGVWPGEPNAAVIKYKEKQANRPVLRGGDANFFPVRSMQLGRGRFYTDAESQHSSPVVVLGYDAANALFEERDPVDKEVTVNGQVFRVVGVLEKSSARGMFGAMNNWEDNAAIIPHGTFHKMYPKIDDYTIVAKARDGNVERMVDDITQLLRRRRNAAFYKPDDFGISTSRSEQDSFGKITVFIGLIIVPISGMALLIGGIGVLNIMLVSVTERTKEIGVRRALGARRTDIIMQFLIEAASLTGFGGVLGIALGLGLSALINVALPDLPSAVSALWVAVGFLVSVGVGLLSGLWPAIKAAYLDPVEALRYE